MVCPKCRSGRCRRSRRHGIKDYSISTLGLRPWRCSTCDSRFYASSVPIPFLFYAHCRRCGNFDLQRIAREHVDGWYAGLFRLAHAPAYRCAPCRKRFFSLLPFHRIRPVDSRPPESSEPKVEPHLRSRVSSG